MRFITEKSFDSWPRLLTYFRGTQWDGWMFRGQGNATWSLKSSLERAAIERFGIPRADLPRLEDNLTRDFQRHAHQLCAGAPERDDLLGWRALMQHWGAPTRLLDWSYSVYVAAFFALADAKPQDRCTIWALDYRWCRKRVYQLRKAITNDELPRSTEKLLLLCPPVAGLYPVNPFKLHERLSIQQAVFVAPGDLQRSFLDNYRRMTPSESDTPLRRVRVNCTPTFLRNAYRDLRRMNVTYATLFPDLEGFAKHIGNLIPVLHRIPYDPSDK